MSTGIATLAAVLLLGAGCAQEMAGAPSMTLDCIPTPVVDDWEALDRLNLIIRTGQERAYRVQFAEPCEGLPFARTIALDSKNGPRLCGEDAVLVRGERCVIAAISLYTGDE